MCEIGEIVPSVVFQNLAYLKLCLKNMFEGDHMVGRTQGQLGTC